MMFNNYNIVKENNEEYLYIYIDPSDTEFADEMSGTSNEERNKKLSEKILQYINNKRINFKGKTVKVMLGSLLVANVVIASSVTTVNNVDAKRNNPNNNSNKNQIVEVIETPVEQTNTFEYIVKSGDTLYSISTKHNVSIAEIQKLNNLDTTFLYVGQVLILPVFDVVNENFYTVQSGDTLYTISSMFNVTTDYLIIINNLTSEVLQTGQTLKIFDETIETTLYTVLPNDTLQSIANKYSVSIENIVKWNNLSNLNINTGQLLTIYHSTEISTDFIAGYDLSSNIIITLSRVETGQVQQISLERYVLGVVASEMPASFELEALKAQALASRTYIMSRIANNPEIIVNDTTEYQAYSDLDELRDVWQGDYDYYLEKVAHAVYVTKGNIITYNGSYIDAVFYSTSNGKTLNSEEYWTNPLPYLKSVDSHWDEASPFYEKTKIISLSEFNSRLGIDNLRSNDEININRFEESNAVSTASFGENTFTGNDIRRKLYLNSTSFDITIENEQVIITMNGWGHGVGMSQYGAHGMAKEGYTVDQIIKHYYTGVEIEKI